MKNQIILHMGLHKTASTSIQATLADNRQALLNAGFFYPDFNVNGKIFNNHGILGSIFYQVLEDLYLENQMNDTHDKPIFESLLESYLKFHTSLIFSGEAISYLPLDNLQSLKNSLEKYGHKIRPIIFIRNPINNMASLIQETLKTGQNNISNLLYNYQPTSLNINNIKAIFPQAEFYSFDQACEHSDGPVAFFIQLLGLDYKIFKIHKENASISMAAGRLLNFLIQNYNIFQDNLNGRQLSKERELIKNIQGSKFTLLKNEIALIYDKLCESRYLLEEVAGIKFKTPAASLDSFPETFIWSNEAIDSLFDVLPEMSESMLFPIYDYFFELHQGNQLQKNDLIKIREKIHHLIEQYIKKHKSLELKNKLLKTQKFENKDVDTLRDAAIKLENIDLSLAMKLMSLALRVRPHGQTINKKILEYKRKLASEEL